MAALSRLALALGLAASAQRASAQATWRLVEELRIGDGSSDATTFADIRGIGVGADGRIFVLEYSTQEIRAFDASGRFLKNIARRGSGPGELRNANGIAQAADGTLWVNDPANARFTLFRPDGSFLRQMVIPITSYGFIWDGMIDARGHLNDPVFVTNTGDERTRKLRRYTPDGARADTVDIPCAGDRNQPAPWTARNVRGSRRGSMVMAVPFTPLVQMRLDPRGFVVCSTGGDYRVARIRLGQGDTTATITRTVAPVRVSPAERAAEIARMDSVLKRYEESTVDYSQIPATKPAVVSLEVDDAGRIWVRRPTPDRNVTPFDVFDDRGRFLATVTAPFRIPQFWHPVIRGDVVYTVALDADDVPVIVRARVKR